MPTPPVESDELLYRQVEPHRGSPIYYDPERRPPIHAQLFCPSSADVDGLSLLRARFRSEVWSGYRPEKDDARFCVVRLEYMEIINCALAAGFTDFPLAPSPDALDVRHGEPWAHCVASAVNRMEYDSSKDAKMKIRSWAKQLELLIVEEHVCGPFHKPTDADPYRPE